MITQERLPPVVVVPTILGPDNVTRVPCGEDTYPRAVADQFQAGRLTISSAADDSEIRVYAPGTWAEVTVYGPDGHVAYGWTGAS